MKRQLGRKEGNALFNDALNTFYLRLYGVRHMVKDHSDSRKGNLLLPHGLLFLINSKGYFICTTDRIAHTTAFVTPVVEHWLERRQLGSRKATCTNGAIWCCRQCSKFTTTMGKIELQQQSLHY